MDTAYAVRVEGNPVTNGRVEIPAESWKQASEIAEAILKALMRIEGCRHRLTVYPVTAGVIVDMEPNYSCGCEKGPGDADTCEECYPIQARIE